MRTPHALTALSTAKAHPRQRDKAASKRALIAAGVEVFSSLGYDAATTRKIADAAGLNEQLITRYFGGKAGLLVAVYEDFLVHQHNNEIYLSLPPLPSVGGEIERFLLFKHQHILRTDKLLKILLPRLILDPTARSQIDKSLIQEGVSVLASRLEAYKRSGQIRDDVDIWRLSLSIVSHSLSMSFLMRATTDEPEDTIIANLTDFARNITMGVTVS